MKITGVEPFVISTFHRNAKRHWLVFKLLTDEGIFGLGDASLHAFDNHLIGINPAGRVHVSERLLMLHDGPLLEQSLKACAGALIRPPRGKLFGPDRDRLAARFEQFKRAA